MKTIKTILVCFILVSASKAEMFKLTTGETIALIALMGGEVAIVIGGISSVVSNANYLNSDFIEEPKLTGDYVVATLNLGMGALILGSSMGENSTWTAIGLGQIALGVAGITTSIAARNKYVKYGPSVLLDSGKKAVVGFNVQLNF